MSKEWERHLTYHGKSKEVCEYVVSSFDKPEYVNNKSIRTWVEASKACLKEMYGV